jgi:hypothetical protein
MAPVQEFEQLPGIMAQLPQAGFRYDPAGGDFESRVFSG